MPCDDPHTSRFVDALAAGCIPVIINDLWNLQVKPFAQLINWDAFTFQIPEMLFRRDPKAAAHWIYDWPEIKLQRMHRALLEARQALLWDHPESLTARLALKQATTECPA